MPKTRQASVTSLDLSAWCKHGEASLVDDLCWGHGDGLLGSLVGTTESIAGPLKGVDVQPHLVDWKPRGLSAVACVEGVVVPGTQLLPDQALPAASMTVRPGA